MWFSSYSIMLNLLLGSSMISANPLNSLSRRKNSDNHVQSSQMSVQCQETVYAAYDLDTAAKEVCNRVREQTHCRDFMSCYYVKVAIPAIPSVSIYAGDLFQEHNIKRSLLKWPLPKRKILERTRYYAIVYLDPDTNKCVTIGAIEKVGKRNYIRCAETKYGSVRTPR